MKKYQAISLALVFVAMATATFAWASRKNENEALLLSKAEFSLTQAVDKALAAVPGNALSAELSDAEHGQLAYVVEVVQANQTYEVTVDAHTGKILDKSFDQADGEGNGREDRD